MSTLEEMFNELAAYAEPPHQRHVLPTDEPIPSLVRQLEHVAQHADFYRAVMSSDDVPAFGSRLREWISALTRTRLKEMDVDPETWLIPFNLVVSYVTGAYVGLIRTWLAEGLRYSPEQMAVYIIRLTTLGVHRAIGIEFPDEGA
jgi:hypothetical protein